MNLKYDVTRPPIHIIEGRRYRLVASGSLTPQDVLGEQARYCEDYDELELAEYSTSIEKVNEGLYIKRLVDIAPAFYKFVIGKQGQTKIRIESDLGVKITVPRPEDITTCIKISGKTMFSVMKAHRQISSIVETHKASLPHTHFMSIPVQAQTIQSNYAKFCKLVMDTYGKSRGVSSALLQNPRKLHLTLCMMKLHNRNDMDLAVTTTSDIVSNLRSQFQPFRVRVKGLDCMNDDPSEVQVLYAKVQTLDGSDRLQMLADHVYSQCCQSGISQSDRGSVKLHVTVMKNTPRRRTDQQEQTDQPIPTAASFDASGIMEVLGDFDFGEFEVRCLHLSERMSVDEETGYYKAVRIFNLFDPTNV